MKTKIQSSAARARFLDGFANEADISRDKADEQWAGFSYALSDSERRKEEDGGFQAGRRNGLAFRETYPD